MKRTLIYLSLGIVLIIGIFFKVFFIGAGENMKFTPSPDQIFPTLAGTTLMGDDFVVPDDFDRPLTLVVIGFQRSHQDDVNTWIAGFKSEGLKDLGLGFYEIPVIYEKEFTQRFFLNNAMKFGVPDPDQKRRTITVYLDRSEFLKSMNMDAEKMYALLIDRSGTILWIHEGLFTVEAAQEIRDIISQQSSLLPKD